MKPKQYRVGRECSAGRIVKLILGQSDQVVVYTTTDGQLRWDYDDNGHLPSKLRSVIQRFDLRMSEIAMSPLSKTEKRTAYHLLGKCLFLVLDSGDSRTAGKYFKPIEDLLAGSREKPSPLDSALPFSDADIERVAGGLILKNGRTTTLGVKKQLRVEGFFAEQRSVSDAMKRVAVTKGWGTRVSGDHLSYGPATRNSPKNESKTGSVVQNVDLKNSSKPVIVLVTVNDHETSAVHNAFLKKENEAKLVRKGGVSYSNLGTHGGYEVIHTICEMGSGGIGASQQRTREAIDHWKPEAIIAVGIAFGLDKRKQKIGDVLVSTQIQDYELGRISKGGSLTPRGDKPSCAASLLNRFRQINAILARSRADWPKVRFGLVLSGQKLVDNLDYRSSLKRLFTEAIGGEMEATGLYVSASAAKVDWIIAKAICDWGYNKNSGKKEAWQKAAAKKAAVVVKAVFAEP